MGVVSMIFWATVISIVGLVKWIDWYLNKD